MSIVQLGSGHGSLLAMISLYRRPNGDIEAVLDDMPVPVIEAEPTISLRFSKAAMWMVEGALSMMRQAVKFDEEAHVAEGQDDDPPLQTI